MRVLYIDLDCARADHLGVNGYHRNTSPNVDRVAREGITFTQCHCSNSPCVPSRAALFSGRFGINNGVVGHHSVGAEFRGASDGPEMPMLQTQLWRFGGMKTVSFSSFADRHRAYWFAEGWEEHHCFTRKRGQETADEVNDAFLPWFQQHCAEDNWFIHLHYFDIHSHYRLTGDWPKRFEGDPAPNWPDEETIAHQQEFYGPRSAVDLYTGYENWGGDGYNAPVDYMPNGIQNRDDFKKLIDGYDAAIAYTDYHVGQVMNVLADAGLLDDTVIVISGDHGDSFGEHGQYMDHGIANEAVHNIPMIVRWPGMPGGLVSDELIYGLDLGPTLCDMLGFSTPSKWDGRSFASAVRGEEFNGWPYQVWDHGIYTLTRSVRTRDHLLINMMHPGLYPYDEPYMLHDLRTDPHQQYNLADEHPEIMGDMLAKLNDWKQEQLGKGAAPDPMEMMVREGPFPYYDPKSMAKRFDITNRPREKEELKLRLRKYHGGKYDGVFRCE